MRRLAEAAALVAGATAVALLCFELLLRAIGFSAPLWYEPDALLGWALRPGVSGWFTREGRAYVRVNSAGQRDRERSRDKPAGVYRIAVLGDSYSEAMQVEREQAFWALLPERLERCGFQPGRRIEVLNFGVSGYGTAQQVLVLKSRALAYRPDLVLLQFTNGNDVSDNLRELAVAKERPFFLLEGDGSLRLDDSFAGSPGFAGRSSPAWALARRLGDHSRVVQLVRDFRSALLFPGAHASAEPSSKGVEQGMEPLVLAPPRDARWKEAWRLTERLIAEVRDLAVRNGAAFMLVSVPYAVQVHPERALRQALAAELGVPDLLYPDRRLAAFGKRARFLAVPLAPEMQKRAEASGAFFHGFPQSGLGRGHWNAEGHRAAADIAAQRLCAKPAG